MAVLRVALVQLEGHVDPAVNLNSIKTTAEAALGLGARLVVFPEMIMALPSGREPLTGVAEPADGPFAGELSALTRSLGIHLVAGLWESVPNETRVYNRLVVFQPDGTQAAAYRKVHLFDALAVKESERMLPGDRPPPVVDVQGVRVGLSICYDLRFPELYRHLAEQGAELFLVPAAWYSGPLKEAHWLTLLRARAIENTVYAAGAVLTGAPFIGRSAAFDPFGVSLTDGGEEEGLNLFEVSPERLGAVRSRLPALNHRRPGLFEGR